jgi:hypothetical protein
MVERAPTVSDEDLIAVEVAFQQALAARSFDGLNVLGYGEIGLALGWPFDQPAAVIKRLPSSPDPADSRVLFDFIRRYEAALEPHVVVTPTDHRTVVGDTGATVPFLIQPLLHRETLAEVILSNTEPEVDHPLVVAVRDAVISSNGAGGQAIDCQFSNFAWTEGTLSLFDTGSPLLYGPDGQPEIELGSYGRVLPAALLPVLRKLITKVSLELATVEGGLAHAALGALRIDQQRWLNPILETFNRELDTPILAADVEAQMARVHKDMRSIKRLARLQRAWSTNVRRRPYDSFITDSFTHEIL